MSFQVALLEWGPNFRGKDCSMKLHIVGSGGRAHALVWKLARLDYITEIVCAPGNAGIGSERLQNGSTVNCIPVLPADIKGQLALAKAHKPHLTIVSEDEPLASGIVDLFQTARLRIWGPNKKAAQFESSKIFAWKFMQKYGIPTPHGTPYDTPWDALEFAKSLGWTCAIKVDGPARGKGVLICSTEDEVRDALRRIFLAHEFGAAGRRVLVQQLVYGQEVSTHFLCNGKGAVAFPNSRDHKRAQEGDKGEMTGGMGAVSPSPDAMPNFHDVIAARIIRPWLEGCAAEGIDFRGIFYPGIMLTADGPLVLEFNARFGDPEAQVYLARLESDLFGLIEASVDGRELSSRMCMWRDNTSVCVVMAAPGYPETPVTGKKITGLEKAAELPNVKIFHAGTAIRGGHLVTDGGRVLGVTAWALDLTEARLRAYRAVNMIKFEGGQHFRRDIGGPIIDAA